MYDNPYYEWLTFYNGGISPTTDTELMFTATCAGSWGWSFKELFADLLSEIESYKNSGHPTPETYARYSRRLKGIALRYALVERQDPITTCYIFKVLEIDRYNELGLFGKIKYNLRKWFL